MNSIKETAMHLTIGKKLGLGFGAVIVLIAASAAIVYVAIARMNASADVVTTKAVPTVRACDEMLNGLNQSMATGRGYVILVEKYPQDAEPLKRERQEVWKDLSDTLNRLKGFFKDVTDPDVRDNFTKVKNNFEPLRSAQQDVETNAGAKDQATRDKAIQLLDKESAPKAAAMREALESLKNAAVKSMGDERKAMDAASASVTATLIAGTLLAIALGSVIAVLLSRKIALALRELLGGVQRVAAGELTGAALDVNSRDEIGDLASGFNQMVASLRGVLAEITRTTAEVAAASREIATSAQQQLASLSQTATSLNQITTTAEEFKTTMQEFADRARAVSDASGETAKRAADGRSLTQDSVSRIEEVRGNSQAAGKSVLNLAEQMQRIGEITATVNEIAEQTKLLALNASIEAARAGESGRGFAVVATQVRELANQSKESAGRIESLIGETQKSMQEVVHKIQEGGTLSEDSAGMVRRVTEAFGEIAKAIEQTREAMAQINTGSRQQEQGITELVTGITQIDSASKESVAAAEQTQKSIVAIDQRIQALNQSIAKFKT